MLDILVRVTVRLLCSLAALILYTMAAIAIGQTTDLTDEALATIIFYSYIPLTIFGIIWCFKPLTGVGMVHTVNLHTSTSTVPISSYSLLNFYRRVRDADIDQHPIKARLNYLGRKDSLLDAYDDHAVSLDNLIRMSPHGIRTVAEELILDRERIVHFNTAIIPNTNSNIAATLDKLDIDYVRAGDNLIVTLHSEWEKVILTALHIVATSLHINRKPEAVGQLYALLGNKTVSIHGQPLDAERLARWAHRQLLNNQPITRPEFDASDSPS